jgi:hypothetical protein
MLKIGVTKFSDGTLSHPKCSSSKIACFIFHQKAPSHETSVVHQFTYEVNQFLSICHANLSQ